MSRRNNHCLLIQIDIRWWIICYFITFVSGPKLQAVASESDCGCRDGACRRLQLHTTISDSLRVALLLMLMGAIIGWHISFLEWPASVKFHILPICFHFVESLLLAVDSKPPEFFLLPTSFFWSDNSYGNSRAACLVHSTFRTNLNVCGESAASPSLRERYPTLMTS